MRLFVIGAARCYRVKSEGKERSPVQTDQRLSERPARVLLFFSGHFWGQNLVRAKAHTRRACPICFTHSRWYCMPKCVAPATVEQKREHVCQPERKTKWRKCVKSVNKSGQSGNKQKQRECVRLRTRALG